MGIRRRGRKRSDRGGWASGSNLSEGRLYRGYETYTYVALDVQAAGVKDGDYVSVKADNERGTVFDHVKIRVDDSFTLEMHIDTDEANASRIATGDTVKIVR